MSLATSWCGHGDSNPNASLHENLNLACLPIPSCPRYYRGKIVGGIYDDRLMVKPVKAALALMQDAPRGCPYEGAKEMLLVENVDDSAFLTKLFEAMYEELPAPKKKK